MSLLTELDSFTLPFLQRCQPYGLEKQFALIRENSYAKCPKRPSQNDFGGGVRPTGQPEMIWFVHPRFHRGLLSSVAPRRGAHPSPSRNVVALCLISWQDGLQWYFSWHSSTPPLPSFEKPPCFSLNPSRKLPFPSRKIPFVPYKIPFLSQTRDLLSTFLAHLSRKIHLPSQKIPFLSWT
jgi:hypothetical protein